MIPKSTAYQAFCLVCCGGGKFLGKPSSKKLAQMVATAHLNVYGHNVHVSHR